MVDLSDYLEGGDKAGASSQPGVPSVRPTEPGVYAWGEVCSDGSIKVNSDVPRPAWFDHSRDAGGDPDVAWAAYDGDEWEPKVGDHCIAGEVPAIGADMHCLQVTLIEEGGRLRGKFWWSNDVTELFFNDPKPVPTFEVGDRVIADFVNNYEHLNGNVATIHTVQEREVSDDPEGFRSSGGYCGIIDGHEYTLWFHASRLADEPLVKEADPELERLLDEEREIEARAGTWEPKVGDVVVVREICDVEDEGFPQVVTLTHVGERCPARDCDHHTMRAVFSSGTDWSFSERECTPYEDFGATPQGRPTVGSIVLVRSIDGDEDYGPLKGRLPAIVEINHDDNDAQPYRATFPDDDDYWFNEKDCAPYSTADIDRIPYSLNGDPGEAESDDDEDDDEDQINGFKVGDRVRVVQNEMDPDEYHGKVGVIKSLDFDDKDEDGHPYLVDLDEIGASWISQVEYEAKSEKSESAEKIFHLLLEDERLHSTIVATMGQTFLEHGYTWRALAAATQRDNHEPVCNALVDIFGFEQKVKATRALRWWLRHFGKTLGLRECIESIDAAYQRKREREA